MPCIVYPRFSRPHIASINARSTGAKPRRGRARLALSLLPVSLVALAACGEKAEARVEPPPPNRVVSESSSMVPTAAAVDSPSRAPEQSATAEATAAAASATAPSNVPAPTPAEEANAIESAELSEHAGVALRRLEVSRSIEDREPVNPSNRFSLGGELYAFVDASNSSDEEQSLRVTFEGPEGRSAGHVTLTIPAHVPRWRTWARTRNIGAPGEWFAEVRSADGTLVGRRPFTVQ